MDVIFIRIDANTKKELILASQKLGMKLTTYCRMILIKSLENNK